MKPLENPPDQRIVRSMPSEDEWAEAGMLADDIASQPLARTPEQGVSEMESRLAHLQRRLEALNAGVKSGQVPDSIAAGSTAWLANQIQQTRQRLAEYRAQLDGRN